MLQTIPLSFFGGAPGGGEILVVLVVLLLLFGAKRLPEMARTLGRTIEEFRRASREVTDEIMRAAGDTSDDTSRLAAKGDEAKEDEHPKPPDDSRKAESDEPGEKT